MTGPRGALDYLDDILDAIEKIEIFTRGIAVMRSSEQSLSAFLAEEPDLYTIRDARVVYR